MSKSRLAFVPFWTGVALAVALASSLSSVATAATKYWKNSAGSGTWTNGNNWSNVSAADAGNDGAPGINDSVIVAPTSGAAPTIDYNATTILTELFVDFAGAGASTLSMPNGTGLTAGRLYVGGWNSGGVTAGRGVVNQMTGSVVVSGVGALDFLDVGVGAGSTGTYNLSGGTLQANTNEYIGDLGTGVFNHTVGTNSIFGAGHHLYLGYNSGASGTYTISGGSLTVTEGNIVVGNSGVGTLTIQNQASVSIASTLSINSSSTVNLNGGTLRFSSATGLNRLNYTAGTIQLAGSRNLSTDAAITSIFGASPTVTAGKELIVEGTASLTQNFANLTVNGGRFKSATYFADAALAGALVITNGGVVTTTGTATVGINNNNGGVANLSGAGSTWNVGDDLILGPNSGGLSRIFVRDSALLYVGDTLQINNNGDIILEGGTIRFADVINYTKIDWRFGTIQLAGDQFIADTGFASLFLVDGSRVVTGRGLTIEGIATLLETVHLEGGTLSVGQLVNASALDLQRGTLNVTNQAVIIAPGGVFGNALDVDENVSIKVTLGITNQGLVTGDGQIGGTFANAATGELRAQAGRSLRLTGSGNTNAGQIKLLGGELEFTQNLTNNAGALISGNGSLIVVGGLVNQGTMNFAGTANILGVVTNSAGGKIISGGGGATIFYDDVTNNGEIRTSTNGFTVFFGAVSGSGTFTGTGTVNFEGDLSPGNSPAAVQFAGDVVLGPDATLQIEIGGITPGSQYDQIIVAGELSLGGALAISLINGFVPIAGQTFDFIVGSDVVGAFSSIELPTLPGLTWNTSQLLSGVLSVVAGLPGDYNQNGTVDAADYTVWRNNLGSGTSLPNDDTAGVGPDDYTRWKTNFGQSAGSGGSADVASVPEPATFALVAMAIGLVFGCRGGRTP